MKRYGMTIPLDGVPLLEQREWIEELDGLGYTDLWSYEGIGLDGLTPLVLASVAKFLRRALAGERVSEEYETFRVENFRLIPKLEEQPKIMIAALRQGMLRLAGRVGDGAILNWLSADDVKQVPRHHGDRNDVQGSHPKSAERDRITAQ